MKLTFCATFLLFTMSAAAQSKGDFDTKAAELQISDQMAYANR
jgi:hypothetical protein